ncbi:Symplekin [Pseudolycoriella hygida]|uniref:Symplekin n=1 Tax=Pseudolycoriella hygida TaxID=35572 RepID=A0A9Q0MMZ7_9DIPT|nr:Symplekin [Pseudolycoriella hygida]
MASLFARKPISVETSSLFTDEKTVTARNKIIEWVNKCSDGSANSQQKCEAITQIQEVLLHSHSDLLDEFIDNLLSFSHDVSQDVRKCVVGFIEEISKLHIDFIPRTINVLAGLLRDISPQVIKRVIQACAAIYKNTLIWLVTLADISDATESSWNTLCHMKAEIVDMIDHDNDGIRTNAIKFLEGIVILQTHHEEDSMKRGNDFSLDDIPLTLKIARRRKLEDEARNIFDSLLKFHAASHISSVNLIACTGSLCTIAKMRPILMNVVVDALKNLLANLPPTLTDSQVSSVRKHLKMQLINILKQHAAYEMQQTIIAMLIDLGASNQEISKSLPKMNKQEQQKRAKRALENATAAAAKRIKMEKDRVPVRRQMEIDYDEVEEQKIRSNRMNEAFITEAMQRNEVIVDLVMVAMKNLPNEMPESFGRTYKPIMGLNVTQVVQKIAEGLSVMMTEKRIGPGASAISRDPPMKVKVTLEEEKNIILGMRKDDFDIDDEMLDLTNEKSMEDIDARREEATKKLRENMERLKGEQAMIPIMKQRAKSLKLQEVTKPMSRAVKEKFLLDAVSRILRAERASIFSGVSVKRRKILTVMAATFTGSVRETIIEFIMKDLKSRIDLAFSWLFEEYSLFQGFTRHSYIKTEQKPDFAYNKLLNELIVGVTESTDIEVNKEDILRRIYLEAPILSDGSVDHLVMMCELTEFSDCAMDLVRDLAVHRPPKKQKFLQILLKYAVHDNSTIREKAIENILCLYAEHKVMMNKIEDYALMWLSYLEKPSPPEQMFSVDYGRPEPTPVWNELLAKICLSLLFALMPHYESLINNLCGIYVGTSAETKRTILKAIELPVKKMGSDSAEILKLIELCPKGSETLITRIIYILTEKRMPNPELVKRVRELYQSKVSDVRLLIPVINGLTKQEVTNALPKLLKLNPTIVKEVFIRLLGLGKDIEHITLPMSAIELLVALHTLDATKVEIKFVVKATALCLAEKDCYTQDVLAIVLQQLVNLTPLPTLLMRTVIQSLTLYPRLAGYITNLLQRLIPKQVWRQKVIWDGFLKCCQRLKPNSYPVLMTLPPPQLIDALNTCPELRQPMIDHANSLIESQSGAVSKITMDILLGKSQDLFITDVSGVPDYGLIPTQNIKVEAEEESDLFGGTTQPLPPGEDV